MPGSAIHQDILHSEEMHAPPDVGPQPQVRMKNFDRFTRSIVSTGAAAIAGVFLFLGADTAIDRIEDEPSKRDLEKCDQLADSVGHTALSREEIEPCLVVSLEDNHTVVRTKTKDDLIAENPPSKMDETFTIAGTEDNPEISFEELIEVRGESYEKRESDEQKLAMKLGGVTGALIGASYSVDKWILRGGEKRQKKPLSPEKKALRLLPLRQRVFMTRTEKKRYLEQSLAREEDQKTDVD